MQVDQSKPLHTYLLTNTIILTVIDPIAQIALPPLGVHKVHERVDVSPARATPHDGRALDHR